jgi:hypothetical protein
MFKLDLITHKNYMLKIVNKSFETNLEGQEVTRNGIRNFPA